ncbi:Radical SAM domain protein [Desulfamplus magnetovallimortis]|uniref:Radical SAM domain protein n=1 Tax=Desulfamplus magnetovallimortis TaxID=1246637 RepID=A0A1W1HHS5_9BACT|nr:radical SAM protein [Desulfamplus magnetovallimortis]SLM31996.1 Radical SAM domain protein [Desulfamplus magnetovallimortis]
MNFEPAYIKIANNGILDEKITLAYDGLKCCNLCPRQCCIDRTSGETGFCMTGKEAIVYSYDAHFGEEAPLVGQNGSGTIFFSFCNMLCNFCQNYEISHKGEGQAVTADQLAFMMLTLQKQGCHNINLVTPSHVVPQILLALQIAISQGLSIPLVYNTGGYDSIETLKLLEGVIDIYMPDFKFNDTEAAELAEVPRDYPDVIKKALLEMYRQVGDLTVDDFGIAQRGLIVRHLVLPEGLAGTRGAMGFLSNKVSKKTYVNIMSQYRPCGTAYQKEFLSRRPTLKEHREAIRIAVEAGLTRFDHHSKLTPMIL